MECGGGSSSSSSNSGVKHLKSQFCYFKQMHPDRDPNDLTRHSRFVQLNEAYTVLNKPYTRRLYDLSLEQGHSFSSWTTSASNMSGKPMSSANNMSEQPESSDGRYSRFILSYRPSFVVSLNFVAWVEKIFTDEHITSILDFGIQTVSRTWIINLTMALKDWGESPIRTSFLDVAFY